MRFERPPLKRLALLLVTVVPALAWALVKPVRVVLPELAGVTCVSATICVDDLSQVPRAQALYSEAVAYVSGNVAPVDGDPRVIFCSTQACANGFGLGARSAVTLGTLATVVGPHAWKPYYVRHELIHYVQGRALGVVPLLLKPSWFVEGMAYGLSQDPRSPLAEPFESDRAKFFAWFKGVGKEKLWAEGAKL
ncbi:MAG: hypothetical protein KF686_18475 [Ramlibacter sp.]|nr:hypothetical protein [Ramlibacter sp.]